MGDLPKQNSFSTIAPPDDEYDLKIDYPKVSFRRLVRDIPSTSYASHGMHYYPAKFIPQVVRWAIEKYTKPGQWVFDPFGGSGTVCVEALVTGRNAVSTDLSPMLKHLYEAKTYRDCNEQGLLSKGYEIINGNNYYDPIWANTKYWYPPEIYEVISNLWGNYLEIKEKNPLLTLALLKTARKFSYGDDQVPKLFKSKMKTKILRELVAGDFKKEIQEFFLDSLRKVCRDANDFRKYYKGGECEIYSGVDMITFQFEKEIDLIITSPPYGQAHEYIRSVKLELGWLGYSDEEIRDFSRKEIPYNKNVPDIEIKSDVLYEYLKKIDGKVRDFAVTYFKSVLFILDKCMNNLVNNGVAAIFIGNATFSGVEFPFHVIFREHFESRGFSFEALLEDEIVGRRLFSGRKNLSPTGMKSEYLLIMRKEYKNEENEDIFEDL